MFIGEVLSVFLFSLVALPLWLWGFAIFGIWFSYPLLGVWACFYLVGLPVRPGRLRIQLWRDLKVYEWDSLAFRISP